MAETSAAKEKTAASPTAAKAATGGKAAIATPTVARKIAAARNGGAERPKPNKISDLPT